jgi:outer membrane lipoprotein SlyB
LPLIVVLALVSGVGVAVAASSTTTTATTPSSTTSSTGTGSTTATTTPTTGSSARDNRGLAGLALLFGMVAIVVVLGFVLLDRRKTLEEYARLSRGGAEVQPTDVPAQAPLEEGVAEAARPVAIAGPNTVVVGAPADFIAQRDGAQVVATWTADPATITGPLGPATSRVSLTAAQAGSFTLTATADGVASAPKQVTAVPAPPSRQVLPFIGAGWGSVVVAIAIAAVTGALGLAGAITGEAVATILGALAGYVVAKGQTETRSPSQPQSGGGGSSGGGAGSGA